MHAAFPAPGHALAGWEIVVRNRPGAERADLVGPRPRGVQGHDRGGPAWKGLSWAREARPLACASRGAAADAAEKCGSMMRKMRPTMQPTMQTMRKATGLYLLLAGLGLAALTLGCGREQTAPNLCDDAS